MSQLLFQILLRLHALEYDSQQRAFTTYIKTWGDKLEEYELQKFILGIDYQEKLSSDTWSNWLVTS